MNNNPKGTKNPKKPLIFYYAVMLLVLMMLNWLLFPSLLQRQVTEVGYDEFISMVDDGKVQTIAYDKQDQEITFEAKNDKGKDALYKTGIFPDDELVCRLLGANVKFAAEIPTQTSPLLSMLISYVVPIVLIIAVGQWLQKKDDEEHGRQHDELRQIQRQDLRRDRDRQDLCRCRRSG